MEAPFLFYPRGSNIQKADGNSVGFTVRTRHAERKL